MLDIGKGPYKDVDLDRKEWENISSSNNFEERNSNKNETGYK